MIGVGIIVATTTIVSVIVTVGRLELAFGHAGTDEAGDADVAGAVAEDMLGAGEELSAVGLCEVRSDKRCYTLEKRRGEAKSRNAPGA